MGGRLDCTNVIQNPIATIINRISMDHTEFLGDTIEKITREKAAIIKDNVPCIIGYQGDHSPAIIEVIKDDARTHHAPMLVCDEQWSVQFAGAQFEFKYGDHTALYSKPALKGDHQVMNAGLALAALKSVEDILSVSTDDINAGLTSVSWAGRLQHLPAAHFDLEPKAQIWLDCGHNDSASEALLRQIKAWKSQGGAAVHLVIGMLGQKDAKRFLQPLLGHIKSLNIVPISSDATTQGADQILSSLSPPEDLEINEFTSAIKAIKALGQRDDSAHILIAGSVYLAGEVLEHIQQG